MKDQHKKPNSIAYYIEEVIQYGAKDRAANGGENGYGPIVTEMLLSILISVRAIRSFFGLGFGLLLGLLMALITKG